MAFVASEEDDDAEEKPEAEVDFNHDDGGKRIELIPNRDILIHKPQVRLAEKLHGRMAPMQCRNVGICSKIQLSPRPIIRTTLSSSALLSSPRLESGSQTDITALRDATDHRKIQNGPIKSKVRVHFLGVTFLGANLRHSSSFILSVVVL